MAEPKYLFLQNYLKELIQQETYKVGDYLPSENELCSKFTITRTTARKALDELLRQGFIEKRQGKGSRVVERRQSLGLLAVKGFSEAVGENEKTVFLQKPIYSKWSEEIMLPIKEAHLHLNCIFFDRLRYVGNVPVMHEKNWFPSTELPDFVDSEFVKGSFFKTLSTNYFIEVTGSTSEIRAEFANRKDAELLKVKEGDPLLHISIIFYTSNPKLSIYSELYCNTNKYPIGNSYYL